MAGPPHSATTPQDWSPPVVSSPPFSLSREPSTKRSRGLSTSSTHSAFSVGQRPYRAISPRQVDDANVQRPSPDSSRKPSFAQHYHSQQASQSQPSGLLRSNTVGSAAPTAQNLPHAPQSPITDADLATSPERLQLSSDSRVAWSSTTLRDSRSSTKSDATIVPHREESQSDSAIDDVPAIPGSYEHQNASVGDFVQAHLIASFVSQANDKISSCPSHNSVQAEAYIGLACKPQTDAKFDRLLSAIGHTASKSPKAFIDSVVYWHEVAVDRHGVSSPGQMHPKSGARSNSNASDVFHARHDGSFTGLPSLSGIHQPTHESLAAERRAILATCLLCRVLHEILRQITLAVLPESVVERLHELIYTHHFRMACRESTDRSPMRQAKWHLLTQVLGALFDLDFDSLSQKVIGDLRGFQRSLGVKGSGDKQVEAEATLLMKGLGPHIKLPCETEKLFLLSCRFMQSVTDLFAAVRGQVAKEAYCQFLGTILLPLAGRGIKWLDLFPWKKFVSVASDRLAQLATKPKYWHIAFPVQSTLVCVSPYDIFSVRWREIISNIPNRLRERNNRSIMLRATCRLTWVYIQRTADSADQVSRNLEELSKFVFFPSRKYFLSKDPTTTEPLTYLLRIIGNFNQELCLRSVVFPLMHYELLLVKDAKDLKHDQIDPDRAVVGVQAFIAIMDDLERRKRLSFPVAFNEEPFQTVMRGSSTSLSAEKYSKRSNSLASVDKPVDPLLSRNLSVVLRDYCNKFCDMLGKLTLVCDNALKTQGGHEHNSSTPKTPISETLSFNRREETLTSGEERFAFIELLHVTIEALPRGLTTRSPLNSLLSVLCTTTARPDEDSALAAGAALKAIATQGHAQLVVDRFSGFISGYDSKFSSVREGTAIVYDRMHPRLMLYVELLRIWVGELLEKMRKSEESSTVNRTEILDVSSSSAQVDRVESQGLFFLCSPSPKVRASAVEILRLVTELDSSLSQSNTRIISVIESESEKIMSTDDRSLTVSQRALLERDLQRRDVRTPLLSLCCSDIEDNITLWYKVFPRFIDAVFFQCPMAVAQTRQDVCAKLAPMQIAIEALDERAQSQQLNHLSDAGTVRHVSRHERRQSASLTEMTVEQWKAYLMFACKTLTRTGQPSNQDPAHTRKTSKSSQMTQDSFNSANDLFSRVLPLLCSANRSIRLAAVAGLGAISLTLYRPLLESLDAAGRPRDDGRRHHAMTHQRAASSPRRSQPSDFGVEIAHVYKLTSHFLQEEVAYKDEWILHHLSVYTRELSMFLHNVERDPEYHALRLHFCGLIEGFFLGANNTSEPHTWMPFHTRRSTFSLMESWSGFRSGNDTRSRDGSFDQQTQSRGFDYRQVVNPKDWAELQNAALSAMATLCAGPLQIQTGNTTHQFDVQRIMQWIHSLFASPGDQKHAIGRRALSKVIIHNTKYSFPLERAIDMFYVAKAPKCLESYIEVVSDVLMKETAPSIPFWKVVTALLFTISHGDSKNRMMSARLLRRLDENQHNKCKLQDLDISISDRTPAVHRKAQFEISKRLAAQYPEHAFHVFSEFSKSLKSLHPDDQRYFVHALLPWLQTIELQVTPLGSPTASSYMLLMNLLEITLGYSAPLQHEIQGLWQALATGPHGGNVKSILDFVIDLCLDRRDSKLVEVARQIIVFLSETPPGEKLIDALLIQIEPRTMTQEKRQRVDVPPDARVFPYLADLPHAQAETVQWTMSLGQLCLILLVDLIVAPQKLPPNQIPSLLQVVLVLWDHHTPLVQEQARELLVHLIHELVISEVGKAGPVPRDIEEFIDLLRERDRKVVWSYDDNEGQASGYDLSEPFQYVVTELARIFATTYPDIQNAWANITLEWGTQCPVRHLACRSLQIYRCILKAPERKTVSELVSRLAITIADDKHDVRIYALELMRTIRTIITKVSQADGLIYPQLLWATCACLHTPLEQEYAEAVNMMEVLLSNIDLSDPNVNALLMESKPSNMSWAPEGLSDLMFRGCTSSKCVDKCLDMLAKLVQAPSNEIIGIGSRLLITILANMPRFANSLELTKGDPLILEASQMARTLGHASRKQSLHDLHHVLESFAEGQLSKDEFIARSLGAIKVSFFPGNEAASLTFQMSLLMNARSWFREEALAFLYLMLNEIDICRTGIPVAESDFVSPLLRLLDTDLNSQALSVLDKLSTVSGTPTNLQAQLEMSMAAPRSNRETRKKFEDTPSIFGIPQESGWSVARPIQCKEKTKSSLSLISVMFVSNPTMLASAMATPEIEFYREESDASYFRTRTGTMTSAEEANLAETNMGELVSKLDTLDDFFDDDDDNGTPGVNTSFYDKMGRNGVNGYAGSSFDSFGSASSEGTNSHMRSYQSSYSSSRAPPTPREAVVMEPSAFAASPPRAKRPGMNPRSVTSPADPRKSDDTSFPVVGPKEPEPFSDDDASFATTSDGSFLADSAARPMTRSRPSFRSVKSGLRKLTGSSDKGRNYRVPNGPDENSPEVPKVPDVFLRNPKSSDL